MTNIHKNFNSRARVGATAMQIFQELNFKVSIHAPVWVRRCCSANWTLFCKFQFTHPCGCDLAAIAAELVIVSFNSRTRVGATDFDEGVAAQTVVSIHAPVWVRLNVNNLSTNAL